MMTNIDKSTDRAESMSICFYHNIDVKYMIVWTMFESWKKALRDTLTPEALCVLLWTTVNWHLANQIATLLQVVVKIKLT